MYDLSFGFLPRVFRPEKNDRYIYEEGDDVTEMYFILKGTWAICFNIFEKAEQRNMEGDGPHSEDDE